MITGAFEADYAIVNIEGIHKDVRLTRERELHVYLAHACIMKPLLQNK